MRLFACVYVDVEYIDTVVIYYCFFLFCHRSSRFLLHTFLHVTFALFIFGYMECLVEKNNTSTVLHVVDFFHSLIILFIFTSKSSCCFTRNVVCVLYVKIEIFIYSTLYAKLPDSVVAITFFLFPLSFYFKLLSNYRYFEVVNFFVAFFLGCSQIIIFKHSSNTRKFLLAHLFQSFHKS